MSFATTSFAKLFSRLPWRPIPNCPGRFILSTSEFDGPPEELLGCPVHSHEFRVAAAPDPAVVVELQDGGLISYRKPHGGFLHTLNTPEGFRRKLEQLGILPSERPESSGNR